MLLHADGRAAESSLFGEAVECQNCGGEGEIEGFEDGPMVWQEGIPCDQWFVVKACPECDGEGVVVP